MTWELQGKVKATGDIQRLQLNHQMAPGIQKAQSTEVPWQYMSRQKRKASPCSVYLQRQQLARKVAQTGL